MSRPLVKVQGWCPMGCGQTLYLDDLGRIYCDEFDCTNFEAAAELLDDRETGHIVVFGQVGFTIRHPLRERIADELMGCDLMGAAQGFDQETIGRFRATRRAGGPEWVFAPLEDVDA